MARHTARVVVAVLWNLRTIEFLSARVGAVVKEPAVSQVVNAVLDIRSCQVSAR